jgi:SPP1 gp7 family putative phage head morphogenesis protein
MPEPIDLSAAIGLEPAAAIRYFEQKGYRISWNWHDTLQEANARAFTVAKVTRLDVLSDIRGALSEALKSGQTERWFENNLTPVLQSKGWWGRQIAVSADGGAEVAQLGSPRRLRTIYRTNMQSAYMAGRYEQFAKNAASRPYFQYVAVMDQKTRPSHAAMHGRVFRWDDPIWETHWPPSAFNCRCRVRALSERNLKDRGLEAETSDGKLRTKMVEAGTDRRTGEIRRTEVTGISLGSRGGKPVTFFTDPGFNYNPARAAYLPDLDRYPADTARQYVEGALTGPEFGRWFSIWQRAVATARQAQPDVSPRQLGASLSRNRGRGMEYPVAVLRDADREVLKTPSQTVLLSTETLIDHLAAHPEIGLDAYQMLPRMLDEGEVYQQDDRRVVLLSTGGKVYRAAIKVDEKRERLYLLTLFETRQAIADRQVRRVMKRLR